MKLCLIIFLWCFGLEKSVSLDVEDDDEFSPKDFAVPTPAAQRSLTTPRPTLSSSDFCRNLVGSDTIQTPRNLFSLIEQSEDLEPSGISITLPDGTTISRLTHKLDGVEVWNSGASISDAPRVRGLCPMGPAKLRGASAPRSLGPQMRTTLGQAVPWSSNLSLSLCSRDWSVDTWDVIHNSTVNRYIYQRENGTLTYADKVEIRGYDGRRRVLFRIFCLVDTISRMIIKSWNGLMPFNGNGGNIKTGMYRYGTTVQNKLPALSDDEGSTCRMENTNGTVLIYNMQSSGNRIEPQQMAPAKYDCQAGSNDEINGGYSPLSDCFFYADKIAQFLTDSNWTYFADLRKYTPSGKLQVGVHYGDRFDNAFWDGNALYMGNGANTFYPLCTCEDVIAHEVGHSVTQMFSDLVYEGEAGCLNEAFSDMMGEAFEFYITGTNDFKISAKCMKPGRFFLRDMSIPSSMSFYKPNSSPHSCSSIFNYAFYKIATSPTWNTQLAFKVFFMANALFWHQNTGMQQAACDVAVAASRAKLGVDLGAVVKSFSAVGIDVSGCTGTETVTSTTVTSSTVQVTIPTTTAFIATSTSTLSTKNPGSGNEIPGVIVLKNCESIYGLRATTGTQLRFRVEVPSGSRSMNIYMNGPNGDADLYVRIRDVPTLKLYNWRPFFKKSVEWVRSRISVTGSYYIMVDAASAFTDLQLTACFF